MIFFGFRESFISSEWSRVQRPPTSVTQLEGPRDRGQTSPASQGLSALEQRSRAAEGGQQPHRAVAFWVSSPAPLSAADRGLIDTMPSLRLRKSGCELPFSLPQSLAAPLIGTAALGSALSWQQRCVSSCPCLTRERPGGVPAARLRPGHRRTPADTGLALMPPKPLHSVSLGHGMLGQRCSGMRGAVEGLSKGPNGAKRG